MRTISKNLKKRLIAQAEEANFQGLEKVAVKLVHQAKTNPIRQDTEEYIYSSAELRHDVENLIWSAIVRAEDYFGKTADAKDIGLVVEALAEELITSVRTKIGGDVIGPHEPLVPGEKRMSVEIKTAGRIFYFSEDSTKSAQYHAPYIQKEIEDLLAKDGLPGLTVRAGVNSSCVPNEPSFGMGSQGGPCVMLYINFDTDPGPEYIGFINQYLQSNFAEAPFRIQPTIKVAGMDPNQ